uniref:DUF4200 domain-containing protein n=1 Tax=Fundulus heteroclitus TaxID=8078 RepID=A0A3Q2QF77_FUNHE
MRKFLALPIEEKAAHAARALAKLKNELVGELEEEDGEEEKNEKKKSLRQIKTAKGFIKKKNRKETTESSCDHFSLSFGSQLSLMTKRSEIQRMERAAAKEERKLKQLEKLIERDNHRFEEFLRENEKKSVEARTLFEREEKARQEKNAAIKKLTAEIGTIQSELDKYEDALMEYQKYREFLFRLSPPEWQEQQKTETSKTDPSPGKAGQDVQNGELIETGIWNHALVWRGSSRAPAESCPPSERPGYPRLRVTRCNRCFVTPWQHLGTQCLGAFDLQDVMLDALSEKVAEVYVSCVDDRATNLSTLEKVANIEKRIASLLQSLESMPEERLAMMKKIKESEKRSRMREEKLMEQREKQKERMRRYLERSLADSKKIVGLQF